MAGFRMPGKTPGKVSLRSVRAVTGAVLTQADHHEKVLRDGVIPVLRALEGHLTALTGRVETLEDENRLLRLRCAALETPWWARVWGRVADGWARLTDRVNTWAPWAPEK